MTRILKLTSTRYTCCFLALLLVMSAFRIWNHNSLPVTLALRSFAETYPMIAAHSASLAPSDLHKTERLIDRAVSTSPANRSVWRALGWFQLAQDRESEALAAWSQIEGMAEELVWVANWELSSGDLPTALEYYLVAITLEPASAEAWFRLGQAYASDAAWRQAIDALREAVRLDKHNRLYWYRLGQAYAELGVAACAMDAFARSLAASSDKIGVSPIHYEFGKLHDSMQGHSSVESALAHYTVALEADEFGDNLWMKGDTYFRRGSIHANAERWRDAALDFENALISYPQRYGAYMALATALWKIDSQEEALLILYQAIELKPESIRARNRLANYLVQTENRQAAIDQLKTVLELDPSNQVAKQRLSRLAP